MLALPAALLLVRPAVVGAEVSAPCVRVQAGAQATSALLLWPRVIVQGGRFPWTGNDALGPIGGTDPYQLRAGLSLSPIDMVRGVKVEQVAGDQCTLLEATDVLRDLAQGAGEQAVLSAYRAQAGYLESQRDGWRGILDRARRQLALGIVTALELQEIRRMVTTLERKVEFASGEVRRLEVLSGGHPGATLELASEDYVRRTMQVEQGLSSMEALDPFQVRLSAGAVASPQQPVGWFGLVEFSYSLGGISQGQARARFLDAREDELRHSRQELPGRALQAAASARAQAGRARTELGILDAEAEAIGSTLAALKDSRAPAAEHVADVFAIEQIFVDSDRVYLRAFVEALSRIAG
jgi:hypothetical protein